MTRGPLGESNRPSTELPELTLNAYLPAGADQRALPMQGAAGAALTAPALYAALDRLEQVVDIEADALHGGARLDFADINRRKSQSLLELTRLARALPNGGGVALRGRLDRLRGKLLEDHRLLGLHLSAVREISDLLVGALAESESDGTYGKTRPRRAIPR